MTIYRFLLRSLRPSTTKYTPAAFSQSLPILHHIITPTLLIPTRSFAFSSAEEAAAERRRMKRRLRIEPPLHALRRDPSAPRPPRDPNAPRLPDSTSALVGPRLNLHNRVQSLIRAGDLDSASAVARQAVFSNTRPTVFTCNAIIAAMYRSKRFSDAKALFHYFFNQSNIVPNIVSYNNLINTHCDEGHVDEGLKVYRHILEAAPFSPSSVTYRHLTKGLVDSGRIGEAMDLLREMLNKGHGADSLVYNNLISGFLNSENLDKANEIFDELKERCLVYDGAVNATFMDWFFSRGREKEAMESYKSLMDRNFKMVPATCNVLLECLLRNGRKTEAWALFDNMLDNHTPPTFNAVNSDTVSFMVNETFKLGKVSEVMDVFRKAGKAPKSKPFAVDVAGYNNIITRFCELEMMEEAEMMFVELTGKSLTPDVTTYRTMIDAYFKVNRVDDALNKYTKMVDVGLRVIPLYANTWFGQLIEKGKVLECAPILTKMGERDPKPDVVSYDMVIRGLCKEGNLDLSFDLLGQMMRYGVGVTPAMREFVSEVFGKEGRLEEVDRLLNVRYPGYAAYTPPSRPPRMAGQMGSPPQMAGQLGGPPRMAGQMGGPSQMAGQMGGPSQMAGQFGGYPQMARQVAGPPQMAGQMGGPSQMEGQFGRHSQTAGQFGGHSQTAGQFGGHSQMAGEVAGPPQMAGQFGGHSQMSGQFGEHSQMAGQLGGHPQMARQVAGPPPVAGQVAGPNQIAAQVGGGHIQMDDGEWGGHPQMEGDAQVAGQGAA